MRVDHVRRQRRPSRAGCPPPAPPRRRSAGCSTSRVDAGALAPLRLRFEQVVARRGQQQDRPRRWTRRGRAPAGPGTPARPSGCRRSARPPGRRRPSPRGTCARPSTARAAESSASLRPDGAGQPRGHVGVAVTACSSLARAASGWSSSRMSAASRDHAHQRPEGDAVAVGQAAPAQHARAGGDLVDHLAHQARLAQPGIADHRDQVRGTGRRPTCW